ncbi:mandelate racemase/muconate lactonizing enzyme family protein [Rhodopila globiformis]|uniref:Mandelate racemase n=1 Tax=Rhodopila globiformis TaxID=1071 RepID=A0A2S6NNF5_RHOGL|nr:mandelate racemase/muconate lactonizing enzyme family protein [Rhodopila globiformis]PPQ38820.1 mandelate racemase [Rhodopila globiformis]
MKIARIETFLFDPGTAKNLLFCRVETDSGLHGWGEAYVTPGKEPVIEHLLRHLAQHIIGRDAFSIRHTAQVVFEDFAMRRTSLDLMSAWSAIEIALWDIVAKHANLPLYNLLGGASRERVKVYANGWSSGTETIEQNVERAVKVKEMGYTALKWDPFPGPWRSFIHREDEDHVVRYVRAMRQALGPDFTLLVEVHRRLAPMHAIRVGRRIAEFDIGWYEEPCLCDNIDLVAEVRRALPMPIVTGEAIYSKEGFAAALAARAADILNPDICNCGGVSAMLDIAAMAQPHAVAIAPHNYNSTLVGLAATVHLSALIPNFWIAECFINLQPACDAIAAAPLTVHEGFVDLPTTPGLGIELDVERLRAKPYRDMGPRTGLRSYTEEFPRKHYAVAATRTGY